MASASLRSFFVNLIPGSTVSCKGYAQSTLAMTSSCSPVPVVPASATTGGPVAFEEEDVDDTGDSCADERDGLQ